MVADPHTPLRLFFGVGPAATAQAAVASLQCTLQRQGARARWVAPADLHLTLRFLGPTSPALLPALQTLLAETAIRHPPHRLTAERIRRWGRLLVIECPDQAPTARLAQALEHGAREFGFAAETRPFRPHLTIAHQFNPPARGQHDGAPGADPCPDPDYPRDQLAFDIDHVALFLSSPDADPQSRYRVLARAALA